MSSHSSHQTITSTVTNDQGNAVHIAYHDTDSFDDLDPTHVTQAYGVCFCENDLVIGFGGKKQAWGLIGGTIEAGENYEQTLRREIKEESNMEILAYAPIGYQKITFADTGKFIFQLRYVCIVRPCGPFIADPAGGITEIALINPQDYKKYFDWGEIGQRIIMRAFELKEALRPTP